MTEHRNNGIHSLINKTNTFNQSTKTTQFHSSLKSLDYY